MIETERLILRGWRAEDTSPFHAMGQDPDVMRYLGPAYDWDAAADVVARQQALQAERGYCFWALEAKHDGAFLGFCGIKPGPDATPIAGQTEIGWRLARDHWGHGFAREAANAVLSWTWINTAEPLVAAITVGDNRRSWGLMERLGMTRYPDEDFDHPALAAGDPLRCHLVYRIQRPLGL
jgi:RimJ/RimL family protein N-acetyltransferase